MAININHATPSDAENITRLIQTLAANEGSQSPLTDNYVPEFLSHPGCSVLLAKWDNQIVGLLSYSVQPNLYHAGLSCSIQELVVETGFRGKGIGSALINALLEQATQLGCKEVSISALPDNQKAIKLYRSLGLVDEAVYLEKHL